MVPLRRYRAEGIQTPMVLLSGEVASAHITNLIGYIRTPRTIQSISNSIRTVSGTGKGSDQLLGRRHTLLPPGHARDTKYPEAAWAFTKFFATHGAAYIASAGHMPAWTGLTLMGSLSWSSVRKNRQQNWSMWNR